ncbi:unnamed protein product, partial [Amoebophrya sp. A25]|eukprot:GSA25T00005827001.1
MQTFVEQCELRASSPGKKAVLEQRSHPNLFDLRKQIAALQEQANSKTTVMSRCEEELDVPSDVEE